MHVSRKMPIGATNASIVDLTLSFFVVKLGFFNKLQTFDYREAALVRSDLLFLRQNCEKRKQMRSNTISPNLYIVP